MGEALFISDRVTLKDLYQLTKPTITLLVVVTAIPNLYLAGMGISFNHALWILLGIALCSGSAAVFNQIVEKDTDQLMFRTKKRAFAASRISFKEALVFASVLGFAGVLTLIWQANLLAAALALGGHFFYVVVYTLYLKKRTPQNIVIGGAAGAVGPLIAQAAVEGRVGLSALLLALIIFVWTPPHFWSLALLYQADYRQAKIPMYPVVYGEAKTKAAIFGYSLLLLPLIISLTLIGKAGFVYLVPAVLLTLKLIFDAFLLIKDENNQRAMPFFHYSCLYILGVFAFLTLDAFL